MKRQIENRYVPLLIAGVILIALAASALVILSPSGTIEEPAGYSGTIRILTTPDIHSHIFAMSGNDSGSRIGRIGALADALGEEDKNTLYLFAGDLGDGNFYHTYAGVPEATAYGMAGMDIAVPGNHAFDYSTELFKTTVSNASYQVICANLDFTDPELNALVQDYTIYDTGDVKIGVFGIITPQLPLIVELDNETTLYENTTAIGNAVVESLEDDGAEIIIALTHQYKEEDTTLAKEVPGIDLIIGGHDHLVWNETVQGPDGNTTLIVHAGKYGEETETVDLALENGTIVATTITRHEITEDLPDNPSITAYLTPFVANYTASLSEGIGLTTMPLDVRKSTLRTGETGAGDYLADTVLEEIPGIDIVFLNAGAIRGDEIIPAGEITWLTLHEILPYDNIIIKLEMSGDEIRETLERSASAIIVEGDGCSVDNRVPSGGFLQVAGLRFDIDTGEQPFCADFDSDEEETQILNAGSRVSNISVVTGSETVLLDLNKTYTVAVNDYIAGGGDGYTNLRAIPVNRTFNTEVDLIDILADRISQESPIGPETDGRINIIR